MGDIFVGVNNALLEFLGEVACAAWAVVLKVLLSEDAFWVQGDPVTSCVVMGSVSKE